MTASAVPAERTAAGDYLELTKPRITLMNVLTALMGFMLASPEAPIAWLLTATLLGTALVAAGASALNMVIERRTDALMRRTLDRPVPAGRLAASEAAAFGLALTTLGLALLAWFSGALAAAVAAVTWLSYVLLYTPLKTRTSLATIVGAFPGALPPVIGWAAARHAIEPGAFVLFAIMFLWQIPHFLAIAWIYREDYARGGLPMLPVLDPEGRITGRQAVAHTLALVVVSLTPPVAGLAGGVYLWGALLLGCAFAGVAVAFAVQRDLVWARRLFLSSLAYLVLLCVIFFLDRLHG
ncbi:MAG: heme o synthase [Vicinamibacteria bacterium]